MSNCKFQEDMEFEIRYFRAHGKLDNSTIKAYPNSASDEIHRLRGRLEYERVGIVAELEAAHRRALAAEDRFAALEATGLMQQVIAPELEDAMAMATAGLGAEGCR